MPKVRKNKRGDIMDFNRRLQLRDLKVLEFINLVKVTNRNQIQKVFFKDVHPTVCMRRLSFLTDGSYVKRARYKQNNGNNGYVYYPGGSKKPSKKLITHNLCVSEFYATMLAAGIEVLAYKPSYAIGNIISDAYIKYRGTDGLIRRIFLEVQMSGKLSDCVLKYTDIKDVIQNEKKNWASVPRLIVVSDLQDDKVQLKNMKVKYTDTQLKNIRSMLF